MYETLGVVRRMYRLICGAGSRPDQGHVRGSEFILPDLHMIGDCMETRCQFTRCCGQCCAKAQIYARRCVLNQNTIARNLVRISIKLYADDAFAVI